MANLPVTVLIMTVVGSTIGFVVGLIKKFVAVDLITDLAVGEIGFVDLEMAVAVVDYLMVVVDY